MSAREEHLPVTKTARIYVLGDAHETQDLWIVCHGYGQLAGRFIRSFEAIAAAERLIVAPEGLHRFYLDPPPAPASKRRVGATWMTREDRETDIEDYVAYLDRVVAHMLPVRGDARVRALGFSQGAATVFRWAALGTTPLDELIVWGGEVPPDLELVAAAERLRRTRIVFAKGDADDFAAASLSAERLAALDRAGLAYEVVEYAGGHALDEATLRRIASRI